MTWFLFQFVFGGGTKEQIHVYFLIFSFMKSGCIVKNLTLSKKRASFPCLLLCLTREYLLQGLGSLIVKQCDLGCGWPCEKNQWDLEWLTLVSMDFQWAEDWAQSYGQSIMPISPNKNSGYQRSCEFSWLAMLCAYCHTLMLGMESCPGAKGRKKRRSSAFITSVLCVLYAFSLGQF